MLSPLPSCLWIFAGCLLHQSSSLGSTSQCQLSNPNVQMCPTHVRKVPCQQGLFPTRSILLPFCQFEWTHPVTWQPPPPFPSPLESSVILFRDELIPRMTRGPKQTDEWLKCIFPLSLIQEESTLSNSARRICLAHQGDAMTQGPDAVPCGSTMAPGPEKDTVR